MGVSKSLIRRIKVNNASQADNSTQAQNANNAQSAVSASYALTASYALNGGGGGGGGSVDTSSLVTTSSFNNFTSSYYIDSASFVANIFKERRYDSSASFSYCGTAPKDSPEESSVWFITRLFISSSGNTTITSASMVNWTNRYTHTYY